MASSSVYRHPLRPNVHPFDLSAGAEILPPASLSTSPDLTSSSSSSESDNEDSVPPKRVGEQWAPHKIVPEQDGTDFLWMMNEEPHRSRRKAILKAHPEVSFSSLVLVAPVNG